MYNLVLDTDSYKTSHFKQYPSGTEKVFSYIEARDNAQYQEIVFFGLHYYLKKYLSKGFTIDDIMEADQVFKEHGVPFNKKGWFDLYFKHAGTLPITIQAVPEGTVLNKGNVLVTIENNDEEFPWLTSYLETALLRAVWYPCTVATISRETKKTIKTYLDMTCDNPDKELPFKLHDFGARGVSSYESAGIGGAAHLINFMGTDTLPALTILKEYYGAENMPGFSIPAMEHSTVCSWGKEAEAEAYYNMVDAFGKSGAILACVSDSYNIYNAVFNIWCSDKMIENIRDRDCTVVIRPDSGNPTEVVLRILDILKEKFGMYENKKGYKVLHDGFKIIQGDGVNLESINAILYRMTANGYSAENIAFGMGGGLLQSVNRDTLSFAMKASAVKRSGVWLPIGKNPVTDKNKSQKKGKLTLRQNEKGEWYTSNDFSWQDKELLWPVFQDGVVMNYPILSDIRGRAAL